MPASQGLAKEGAVSDLGLARDWEAIEDQVSGGDMMLERGSLQRTIRQCSLPPPRGPQEDGRLLVASPLCFRSEMPFPAPLSRCLFHTTFAEAAEPKGKATRDPQASLDPDTHVRSPRASGGHLALRTA